MKKKTLSKLFAITLSLAMSLSLAACGGSADPSANDGSKTPDSSTEDTKKPALEEGSGTTDEEGSFQRKTEEGTLTVGTSRDQGGFDLANSDNTCGIWLMYEQLLQMNPKTGAYEPLLAESYEYVDDTHIKFTLRSDATFSDGSPVTSNDVLVSWKHFLESETQWIYYLSWVDIDNFEIVDDSTFIVAMNDSYTFAEAYLCNRYASVLKAEWIENASDEDWWMGAIATGPYTCTANESGSHAVFERNDNYWNADKMPEPTTVTVRYYTSSATMMVDYESGALDAALEIDGTDAERVLNGQVEGTNYDLISRSDVYTLALPEYVEDFQDINVRQAISLAIDTDAVCEAGLGVLGMSPTSILPSDCNYYADMTGIGANSYDPEAAKQLLADCNFQQSHPYVFVVPNFDYNVKMSEAIQAYLEAVGIEIELVQADLVTCITEYFMTGKAEMVINSCGCANHNADQQLNTTYSMSTNATVRITDETYNSYVETSRTSTDDSAVQEAYTNLQTWMAENCRQISLAEPMVMNVYHSYIGEINSPVYDYNYLRYVVFK